MGTLESLPHELLTLILFYAGDSVKDSRLMAVNKHWYNLFLSVTFAAPVISLRFDCPKYNAIIKSPFYPGKWVTSITLRYLKCTYSRLYTLIMYTPHVEQVKFSCTEEFEEEVWLKLYRVLQVTNIWKLRRLPDNWNITSIDDQDSLVAYQIYLKCAQCLTGSLSSIRLIKQSILDHSNISFLKEFTALESLKIDKGFFEKICHLDNLLKYTPQLEELEMDFTDTEFHPDTHNDRSILNGVYSNIKTLNLHNFAFQTDSQVAMFHTNFTGLRKLHMSCSQIRLNFKPKTTRNFFTMLASLQNYKIIFNRKLVDVSDFINKNFQQELHASVCSSSRYNESITIRKSGLVPTTMLKYKFYRDYSAKRILSVLGSNIQQLEFLYYKKETDGLFLDTLLSNPQKNLRSIVFKKIKYHQYSKDYYNTTSFASYTQNITFNYCYLSESILYYLSCRFTTLDTMHINDCDFEGSGNVPWLNVAMPKTDIRNLCISYSLPFREFDEDLNQSLLWGDDKPKENPSTFPLISITLVDQDVKRYFYTRNQEGQEVVETTKTQFYLLAQDIPFRVLNKIVCISVKSIQKLSLKMGNRQQSKAIHLVF